MAKFTKMVELARRVSQALLDPENITYSLLDDVYPALIEADTAIQLARPDVNSEVRVITTVAGFRQSIPATDLRLLDVSCNLDPITEVELSDIRLTEKGKMHPNWRTDPASNTVLGYLFDDRVPTQFEVYPPVNASRKLRVITSVPFEDYGTIDGTTDSQLASTYDAPKVEFALYRCMSRDGSPLASRAQGHLSVFERMLGIKQTRDTNASPKAGHQSS